MKLTRKQAWRLVASLMGIAAFVIRPPRIEASEVLPIKEINKDNKLLSAMLMQGTDLNVTLDSKYKTISFAWGDERKEISLKELFEAL